MDPRYLGEIFYLNHSIHKSWNKNQTKNKAILSKVQQVFAQISLINKYEFFWTPNVTQ